MPPKGRDNHLRKTVTTAIILSLENNTTPTSESTMIDLTTLSCDGATCSGVEGFELFGTHSEDCSFGSALESNRLAAERVRIAKHAEREAAMTDEDQDFLAAERASMPDQSKMGLTEAPISDGHNELAANMGHSN